MTPRAGFALITVVLLMIGLGVLATGLVFAAAQQVTVVGTMHDMARGRLGAEAAVSMALARWSAANRSLDPVGVPVTLLDGVPIDVGVIVGATSRRLDAATFLIAGSARVRRGGSPPLTRHAERIVRSVDVDSIGRALDAAIIAQQVTALGGAVINGNGGGATARPEAGPLCAGWPAEGAAVRTRTLTMAPGAVITGSPPAVPDADVERFLRGLGILSLEQLRAVAARIDESVFTAPDPDSTPMLRHAPRDLTMKGGAGEGVLIVDGDLELAEGARFRGILLATGTVTIRDASTAGVVIGARVEIGGMAALDRCALADAFTAIDPLRRPHPPARSWLPTFD